MQQNKIDDGQTCNTNAIIDWVATLAVIIYADGNGPRSCFVHMHSWYSV